ncbi:Cyclopropane-fatty-acyl-phospholipid synthase [Gossypium australe]|uniref:Cyclopropane-fatty-acyl-phospholipid synthase n=1 Tax=Gossypium australe TaxID=47621 RepID=A0A5B6UZR3_9ROSI|nr:Cyclopropane-fatty-acyl-phospholipid synthase [Gossypium australe]
MGGLGFRDLHLFNLALLGRQVWMLLNHRDTLCYQVISSKYFPNDDLFHPKAVDKPSYTWKGERPVEHWPTKLEKREEPTEESFGSLTCSQKYNNRNNHIFRSKEDEARVVRERATTLSNEWKKPLCGFVNVNFDASIAPNKTGYGIVARDEDGFVVGRVAGFKEETLTVEWAEIYALEESLKLARTLNISKALFETDYASLANRVKKRDLDITITGTRIKEIHKTMENFESISNCLTNQKCNKVANFICKDAINKYCIWTFAIDYLDIIHALVINDSIN